MRTFRIVSFLFLLLNSFLVSAQLQERILKINVVPNHDDWNYKVGETVEFDVAVTKNRVPMKNVEVWYEISEDMQPPIKKEKLVLENGKLTINAGTMKVPGFLRCRVWTRYEGRSLVEGRATVGFSPELLIPIAQCPDDFDEYWKNNLEKNKKLAMKPKLRLLTERCTASVNVYELSIQSHHNGRYIYGILCVPAAPGKYPAMLKVPAAGVRSYSGDVTSAEKGIITLEIGAHGIPVTLPEEVYSDLSQGALYRYQYANWDNRDEVAYNKIYLSCISAAEYITKLDKFDGKNLVVYGESQGGALSIVTAALCEKITGVVSFYPALCDIAADMNGRAGGWPHLLMHTNDDQDLLIRKKKVSEYYDVANFAKRLKVPVLFYLGYNDMVCPPTSTYSVYNIIKTPKQLIKMQEAEHYAYPEHRDEAINWIYSLLGVKK